MAFLRAFVPLCEKLTSYEIIKFYFEDYVEFFNELANKNKDVSRKKLDEALWAFGKFLKTPYGKRVSSP